MAKEKANARDVFLDISAVLTGFSPIELLGTGMLDTYFNTVAAHTNPDVVTFFYQEAERILSIGDPAKIHAEIKTNLLPKGCYRGLAQNIITMWYMGTWNDNPVSAQAYVQGLVWEASETHPPGAKQPGYDSWSKPPIKINC